MFYIANSFDVVLSGMKGNHAKFETTLISNPATMVNPNSEIAVVVKTRKDIKKLSRMLAIDLFPRVNETLVKAGTINFERQDSALVYIESVGDDGVWYLIHRSI